MTTAADMPTTGRFLDREHRFAIRVYFEDTDISGVVYHANYLRFCERARSDMLRLVDIDLRGAWERGEGTYVVRTANLRYRAPARLDDALTVVSRVTRIRAAAVDIHQRVMRGDSILVRRESKSRSSHRPVRRGASPVSGWTRSRRYCGKGIEWISWSIRMQRRCRRSACSCRPTGWCGS